MRVALRQNDKQKIEEIYKLSNSNPTLQK